MKVHLAGIAGMKKEIESGVIDATGTFMLESFYSFKDWQIPLIKKCGSFLLDSGAYTFMQAASKHGNTDWMKYADSYADFIKAHGVTQYFELDIDNLMGLKYVEKLRDRIESRSGVQCIPVWHVERGKDYFEWMVKNYKFVALGSIANVVPGKQRITDRYFPYFLNTAHKEGCKVHALGYTNLEGLKKYRFDSVDSTTWTAGSRFGQVCVFRDGTIKKIASIEKGQKVRSIRRDVNISLFNFREWLKFQQYADKFL